MISEFAGIVKVFLIEKPGGILLFLLRMRKIHTGIHTFSGFIEPLFFDMFNPTKRPMAKGTRM